jgi:mannose-1-phosphate guanylyltransferase
MDNIIIKPVILCGGSGTRLWPISSATTPKQLLEIGDKGTLLEETLRRIDKLKASSDNILEPVMVMNSSHIIPSLSSDLQQYQNNIIYETIANDTAIAILRTCISLREQFNNKNNIYILVFPADHYIYNPDYFIQDILDGLSKLKSDNILLYGIQPTSPESKYGYIYEIDNSIHFKEKPSSEIAQSLINNGALWNSGIFCANLNLIYDLLISSKYNLLDWINNEKIIKAPSFDIAILQEYSNIIVHKSSNWKWCDIGTWDTFINIPEIQTEILANNNNTIEKSTNVNVLNRSSFNIYVLGCSNLIVAVQDNNILILDTTNDHNSNLKSFASNL